MKKYIKPIILITCTCFLGSSMAVFKYRGTSTGGYPGGSYIRDPFIWQPPPIVVPGDSGVVTPGGYSVRPGLSSIYPYYDPSGKRLYYYFENGQIVYYTYDAFNKIIHFYYDSSGQKVYYYR